MFSARPSLSEQVESQPWPKPSAPPDLPLLLRQRPAPKPRPRHPARYATPLRLPLDETQDLKPPAPAVEPEAVQEKAPGGGPGAAGAGGENGAPPPPGHRPNRG